MEKGDSVDQRLARNLQQGQRGRTKEHARLLSLYAYQQLAQSRQRHASSDDMDCTPEEESMDAERGHNNNNNNNSNNNNSNNMKRASGNGHGHSNGGNPRHRRTSNSRDENRLTSLHIYASKGRLVDAAFRLATTQKDASAVLSHQHQHQQPHQQHQQHQQCTGDTQRQGKNRAVDARDAAGWTPLHDAVAAGDAAMTALLLQSGADPNARGPGGHTPLHVAALQGGELLMELLVACGADRRQQTDQGDTPMQLLPTASLCAQQLLAPEPSLPADAATTTAEQQAVGHRQRVLLALYQAIGRGAWAHVRHILSGQTAKELSRVINTPLHRGERIYPLHAAIAVRHLGITGDLLRAGAKLDPQTRMGNTPLHVAVVSGEPLLVWRLLTAGANKLTINNDGNTPFDLLGQARREQPTNRQFAVLHRVAMMATQPLPHVKRRSVSLSATSAVTACK
ncbi:hypothetical protein PTSG_01541 [Salpingoeca rosetta]|uniref:Uncharacterized protein n=1 Tax=Salpingoeca rosetta (strain ATCC 50818 / BSB-021) TaxID=946362 RepID=F2U0N0_SALR5|nr:uncharacterized protein PTSG_01541 [Salpingoeca rosetta]EGD80958.1 hypothetical protein PTSG_01541 [Salpingoeca rosetta]|eukprot:XP_004997519.1 hypothetical protein PTSG_01541 [Salpingoeca rosetta]